MHVGFFGGGVAQPPVCYVLIDVSLHIAMPLTFIFSVFWFVHNVFSVF